MTAGLARSPHAALRAIRQLMLESASAGATGFDDQQARGRHAAAIEHPQSVFLAFVRRLLAMDRCEVLVQIGVGGDGTRERALRCVVPEVVTLRAAGGEPGDGEAPDGIDVLLIDRDDGAADAAEAWRTLAPKVRPGGLVAIVDRSLEHVDARRPDDVDRFVFELEQRFLRPRGRALERLGDGHAIHLYVRSQQDDEGAALLRLGGAGPPWRRARSPVDGFSVFCGPDRWVGVAGDHAAYRDRDRSRHAYDLVLSGRTEAELAAMLAFWVTAERLATDALRQLAAGHGDGWSRSETAARALDPACGPWFERWLLEQPHGRRLLRVAGTVWTARGDPDLGAALLQRLIDDDLADGMAVSALAQIHMRMRQRPDAARDLLHELKHRVRLRQRRQLCISAAPQHPVWTQPELLADARSMLWIGPGGAASARFADELDIALTWLPHGHGASVAAPCTVLDQWVSDEPGARPAFREPGGAVTLRPWTPSFRASHRGAGLEDLGVREVTTLDDLASSKAIDIEAVEVLVIDAPGEEAAILRGARNLLTHVRVICVAMHHHTVYEGTEPHHALVRWLDERGFAFAGADPTSVGHRVVGFLARVE